ncbi:MAG: tetratricopeptide repeat protein, partial [Thermoplasmata archaeon]|nr:tetratricopeptide repeat protein [Thermoplasmata archaeon]
MKESNTPKKGPEDVNNGINRVRFNLNSEDPIEKGRYPVLKGEVEERKERAVLKGGLRSRETGTGLGWYKGVKPAKGAVFLKKTRQMIHETWDQWVKRLKESVENAQEKEKKKEVFNPVLISIQEIIMLSSCLLLAAIFLIFILFKDFWYHHFDVINTTLLSVFGVITLLGLVIIYFSDSDNPRLRGSIFKKMIFSRIGLILIISGSAVLTFQWGETGLIPLASGIVAAVGVFFFIISSRSMSKWEAYRFIPFFVGALLMVLVPVHETMKVNTTDYETLPMAPINTALLVLGGSLIIFGVYMLRERSGYFGVWLFGMIILFLIPLHESFEFIETNAYQPYDQTLGMVGALLLIAGHFNFFYRYHQYISMSKYIYAGDRFYEEGRWKEAETEYWKAYWLLERMGNLLDYEVIWGNLGNIYARKKDYDSALAYIAIGLNINRNNDALWNDKGNILYELREYQKAIDAYKRGIEINEENPVLFQNLGVALSTTGLHEEAIKNYDQAIKLDPKYDEAWHNKGKSLHDLRHLEEALKCYDTALRLNQESAAWLDKGDVLYLMKRYKKAFKAHNRAIENSPKKPECWIHKGVTLYALQKYDEAINAFNRAIELDNELVVPYNLLGNAFASLGNLEKAKENYEMAVEKNPRYSRARFNLARTLAVLGEDALKAYEEAVRGTTPQRLNQLWFEEAVQYYNNIIDKNPDNAEAWGARGDLLFKIGRVNSAISSYTTAVEKSPGNPVLHNLLGISLGRTQRFEEALKSFNKATNLDKNFAEAWNNKGNVLYRMGHF